MLLIHSETVTFLARAACSIAFRSSPVKRTGTIRPFASPFAILGRPTLAFFGCANSRLLNDKGLYRVLGGLHEMRVQDCDVTTGISGIVRIMRPRVNPLRRGMIFQVKYFNNPFPYRLPMKRLFHRNAFNVRSVSPMLPHDRIALNISNAFDAPNAGAFGQGCDYRGLLVGAEYVCHVHYCITVIKDCQVLLCYSIVQMRFLAWLRQIQNALHEWAESIRRTEKRKRDQQMPRDKPMEVRAIVAFDDKTIANTTAQDERNHATQNSIKNATWWAFFAVAANAVVTTFMWCQMMKQTRILEGQLSLARDANRPWIRVAVTANTDYVPGAFIGGPLSFDQNGRGSLTSKITMENIGKSVAGHVYSRTKVVAIGISADQLDIPIEEQKKLCSGLNTYDTKQYRLDPRLTIFPNDTEVEFEKSTFETS